MSHNLQRWSQTNYVLYDLLSFNISTYCKNTPNQIGLGPSLRIMRQILVINHQLVINIMKHQFESIIGSLDNKLLNRNYLHLHTQSKDDFWHSYRKINLKNIINLWIFFTQYFGFI